MNITPRLDGRRFDRNLNSALGRIAAAPLMTGIEERFVAKSVTQT
jgi:hypothetical protein